jgi:hypothetical protein
MASTKLPVRVVARSNPTWLLLKIGMLILAMMILAAADGLAQQEPKILGGTGVIDRFEEDEIVIDDILYKLASDVIFYQSHKLYTYALRSSFKVGKWVGFKLNDDGKISALWFSKVGG